jgi:hypothetical protein
MATPATRVPSAGSAVSASMICSTSAATWSGSICEVPSEPVVKACGTLWASRRTGRPAAS